MKATLLFLPLLLITWCSLALAADTSAASKRIDELLATGLQKHGLKPNALVCLLLTNAGWAAC
jgi:hypothetical protein